MKGGGPEETRVFPSNLNLTGGSTRKPVYCRAEAWGWPSLRSSLTCGRVSGRKRPALGPQNASRNSEERARWWVSYSLSSGSHRESEGQVFHPLTRKQIMSGLLFHTAPLVSTFQPPDPGYRSESEEQDSSPSQNCFLCFLQRVLWFGVLFFLEEASGAEERAALGWPPAGGLLRSLASPSLSLPKALEGKRRKKTSSRGFQPIPLCKHPQPPFQKDHSRFRDAPTPPHPV